MASEAAHLTEEQSESTDLANRFSQHRVETPRTPLGSAENPLLAKKTPPPVAVDRLHCQTSTRYQTKTARRKLRDARRLKTAADAIHGLDHEYSIEGVTLGQFSLIQLLEAALDITGPIDQLDICTWTAANNDVTDVIAFCESGKIRAARWFVDLSFHNRAPQLAQRIRQAFGKDAIRVGSIHAKLQILRNSEWDVVIRTSMNLNQNPRLENYTIGHDPDLADFYGQIIDAAWQTQKEGDEGLRPYETEKHFLDTFGA